MSRFEEIENGLTQAISERTRIPNYSTLSLVSSLERLGCVVFPFSDLRVTWTAENHQFILQGCEVFTHRYPAVGNIVVWLNLDGIVMDLHCEAEQDAFAVKTYIEKAFVGCDINSLHGIYKNGKKTLRFLITFKAITAS
jgi:hypothetical protein